jgi:pyocin large subunit-like protein
MNRLLLTGALVLALAGCQDAPTSRVYAAVLVGETAHTLDAESLCWFARDAVQRIVLEQLAAPPGDAPLTKQTAESYGRFADRLRELSTFAETEESRRKIERAANASDRYVTEVQRRNTWRAVDVQPVIDASYDAFPACNLDG